jgi:hypothetical protein
MPAKAGFELVHGFRRDDAWIPDRASLVRNDRKVFLGKSGSMEYIAGAIVHWIVELLHYWYTEKAKYGWE